MGRMGSTRSVRARQMRRELARWQRSGLKLREYGQQHGIPLSTLSWWRRVFRRAGEEHVNGEAGENPVVFTEVPKPANVPRTATVVECTASTIFADRDNYFCRLAARVD